LWDSEVRLARAKGKEASDLTARRPRPYLYPSFVNPAVIGRVRATIHGLFMETES
jgi:hypothetical protein